MSSVNPRDQRGSVLVGGLMLVLIITFVGLAIFDLSLSEPRLIADRVNKDQAVYTAEAGMNIAWQALTSGTLTNLCAGRPGFTAAWCQPAHVPGVDATSTNIVPKASVTATVPPSTGVAPGFQVTYFQRTYQVVKCTGPLPPNPVSWDDNCNGSGLQPGEMSVRAHGRVARQADNGTVSHAVAELVFARKGFSIIVIDANMSGAGGLVDSWDSSKPTATCATPPCPYDAASATAKGDMYANGTLSFSNPDPIKGSLTAAGSIHLFGNSVSGSVQSGGTISNQPTAPSSTISGDVTATGSFTGTGTVTGNATAGGAIDSTQVVSGTKTPNATPAPAAPPVYGFDPVQDCNAVGTSPGQYSAGDPNRAASGYSTATYVASKLRASGFLPFICPVSGGVVKAATSATTCSTLAQVVYTESTGVFSVPGSTTLTVNLGSSPPSGALNFCFNRMTTNLSAQLALSTDATTGITSTHPVQIFLTGSGASGCCATNMLSGTVVNATHDASRLQIYSSATNVNNGIALSGNSNAYMTIYAPNTNVTLSGGSALYGSVVANQFSGTGGSDLHYDSSLANSTNCALCPAKWVRQPSTWKITLLP